MRTIGPLNLPACRNSETCFMKRLLAKYLLKMAEMKHLSFCEKLIKENLWIKPTLHDDDLWVLITSNLGKIINIHSTVY